jgi:hypothetical protein
MRWVAGGVARPVRRWKVIAEAAQEGREVREEMREAFPAVLQDAGHGYNQRVADHWQLGPSETRLATADRSSHP